MVLAQDGVPPLRLMVTTLVGGALAAGGANAMNMVIDRDIDRLMPRTQGRPLVTGLVAPREAVIFAIALEVAAFVLLTWQVNLLSAVLALAAMAFYVVVYTIWLKRTSTQNIVIGGAAGAVPVLVGWAAVTGSLAWPPVVLFVAIFLWTPPHFWALAIRYADDYRAANVPMLPAVASPVVVGRRMLGYTVALWACTLVLVPVAGLGWIYTRHGHRARRPLRRRLPRPPEGAHGPPVDAGLRLLDLLRDHPLQRHGARRPGALRLVTATVPAATVEDFWPGREPWVMSPRTSDPACVTRAAGAIRER